MWRAEDQWPPADAAAYTTELSPGTYTDDGAVDTKTGSGANDRRLDRLAAADHDADPGRRAGHAAVDVSSAAPPAANLVVDVYDIGRRPARARSSAARAT